MTGRGQTKSQNLDLAVIGNSCSAALIDRNARIVWWCFPYFDSDPIFSRLLADDEDKGFCEVTLADMVETNSHVHVGNPRQINNCENSIRKAVVHSQRVIRGGKHLANGQ